MLQCSNVLKLENFMFNINFMQQAYKEAEKALAIGEIPVGAVIVYDNKIIARAHNESIKKNDPTAHAEILAIRKAGKILKNYRLNSAILYVTLEPCPMCACSASWARIDTIIYGASDKKFGSCGTVFSLHNNTNLNHKIKIVKGVMEYKCSKILKDFFKSRR
jgi:tRNA(adenine34) deaminase